MPSDLSAIDLATLVAVRELIATTIRHQCCQWEQDSADAAADGRLVNALMLEHWAFAADILATKVSSEFTSLFVRSLDARMNWSSTTRSVEEQLLDALTLEVASQQSEPLMSC